MSDSTDKKLAMKFTEDYEVQDEHRGTDKATTFKKGTRVMLAADSAAHFMRRGVASPATKTASDALKDVG